MILTPEYDHWIDCELEDCARCDDYDRNEGHYESEYTWAEHKSQHLYNTNFKYSYSEDGYCKYCEGDAAPAWIEQSKIVSDYTKAHDSLTPLFYDTDRRINLWYMAMGPVENLDVETIWPTVERYGIFDRTLPPLGYRITINDKNGNALEQFKVDDMMYFYTEFPDDPERSNTRIEFYVLSSFPAGLPYWFFPTLVDIHALNAQFDKQATEKSGQDFVDGLNKDDQGVYKL